MEVTRPARLRALAAQPGEGRVEDDQGDRRPVLLISAGLLVVITLGGWPRLQGASVAIMSLLWAGLYVLFAFLVSRWNRGVLPVASALAIILAIFAAIAAPAWFARSKAGLRPPPLPDDLLGLLTLLVVPVQLLLITVAMVGFNQDWQVEEERPVGGVPLAGEDDVPRRARTAEAGRRARLDQVRPVLANVVDAVADLAEREQLLGRRGQQRRELLLGGVRVEPRGLRLRAQDDRHPVVDRADQPVRLAGDDRAAVQDLGAAALSPAPPTCRRTRTGRRPGG